MLTKKILQFLPKTLTPLWLTVWVQNLKIVKNKQILIFVSRTHLVESATKMATKNSYY